jgi:WD40 repeat protein
MGGYGEYITIMNDQGTRLDCIPSKGWTKNVLFSKDNCWLFVATGTTLYSWNRFTTSIQSSISYKNHITKLLLTSDEDHIFVKTAGALHSVPLVSHYTSYSIPIYNSHKSFAVTKDGEMLALITPDQYISLYDARTGKLKTNLESKRVVALIISPDGQKIAAKSNDNKIMFYDLQRQCILVVPVGGYVRKLQFNKTGSHCVISVNYTGHILFDLTKNSVEKYIKLKGTVVSAFNADKTLIAATGLSNKHVGIYSMETGEKVGHVELPERQNAKLKLRFSPDNLELVVKQTIYNWGEETIISSYAIFNTINDAIDRCTLEQALLLACVGTYQQAFIQNDYWAKHANKLPDFLKKRLDYFKPKPTDWLTSFLSSMALFIEYINPWQESDVS